MRLRIRLLLFLLLALFRPRLRPTDFSVLRLRVLPNDVDVRHVTNDRFLAYMDLGRNDLAIRLGLLRAVRVLGAVPTARTISIRYRRPIGLFQSVEIRTRLVCWTDYSAWIEQDMFVRGRSVALAYCNVEMRNRAGNVPTQELLKLAGHSGVTSPEPPPLIAVLEDADARLRALQQDNGIRASKRGEA